MSRDISLIKDRQQVCPILLQVVPQIKVMNDTIKFFNKEFYAKAEGSGGRIATNRVYFKNTLIKGI